MQSLLKITAQCCDAGNYLDLGHQCAVEGVCHGPLRPMGDYYWFSIPERLHLAPDVLVWLNLFSVVLSVVLSIVAFRQLLGITGNTGSPGKDRLQKWGLLLASVIVHAIFFYPVLFHSLSDPPASSMLLCGLWLAILSRQNDSMAEAFLLMDAGLCWGLAAWLRAFFLYPVLAGLVIYVAYWLMTSTRRWSQLWLLSALLPIGSQFLVMHSTYGKFSYIQEEELHAWSDVHLNQPFVGYDTIFPHNGYFWFPKHCQTSLGILNGLKSGNYVDVVCIIKDRLYFYLGTYVPETYLFSGVVNQLVRESVEDVGNIEKDWWSKDLSFTPDVTLDPVGLQTADKLTVTHAAPDGAGDVMQWVTLKGNAVHTFSIWLWSPFPRTINLVIARQYDGHLIAMKQVTLTSLPQRYSVTGRTQESALYSAEVGAPYRQSMTLGKKEGDYFFAWGAQLEASDHMTDYTADEPIKQDDVRVWSPLLLFLNLAAILVSLVFVIQRRDFFLRKPQGLALIVLVYAIIAEGLIIIPEQRFSIVFMVWIWLTTLVFLLDLLRKKPGVAREPSH